MCWLTLSKRLSWNITRPCLYRAVSRLLSWEDCRWQGLYPIDKTISLVTRQNYRLMTNYCRAITIKAYRVIFTDNCPYFHYKRSPLSRWAFWERWVRVKWHGGSANYLWNTWEYLFHALNATYMVLSDNGGVCFLLMLRRCIILEDLHINLKHESPSINVRLSLI